jgi:hypothetical protein
MHSTHNKYGSRKIGRRYKTTLSCIQLTINMEAERLADDIKQHCHVFN